MIRGPEDKYRCQYIYIYIYIYINIYKYIEIRNREGGTSILQFFMR
ncbi:MAG: hypothetical protein MCS20_02365 [Candidatus Phytoplasma mali]|nr:hypothetical protein [Candidatus Phytoplasma mali]MCZ8633109.1 hypothetical protein [Spiroplasma sp. Tabriz.8]